MEIRIPVYRPSLIGNEKKYVNECLDSTWISSKGKFIKQFEDSFAGYVGVSYAASVCNGTVAIHNALLALGIKEGDEVIVPTFTYIASVNPIVYTGATPVFVDSLRDTWQIDPSDIERKITSRTRAIMVVHLYGHPCDMDRIMAIARKHHLFVIEDCAEAFGSKYHDQYVGTFGDIAAFSFFGNKTITTGEGGMVTTNDRTLHERTTHFKGQGLAKYREYWHDTIGYNYRMTNICAAIGLAQLEKADEIIKKKRQVAAWYKKYLMSLPLEMHTESGNVFNTYWMVCVLVEQADLRDGLRKHLLENGIETRPTFYPIHAMPMYAHNFYRLPVAEDISWRGINLPSYPDLTEKDIQEICSLIADFYGK
jgi:perosamine synthetase